LMLFIFWSIPPPPSFPSLSPFLSTVSFLVLYP
jgi:hypothetical protein